MKSYLTLSDAKAEIIVQRSRFIAYLYHIGSEDDAKEKLAELKKRHYDATHVCYAYIADESGNTSKTSDDGEPSGTAGAPILAVIAKYRKVLLAVVRYFGGTKLGVGGLVKAYTDVAVEVTGKVKSEEFLESDIYEIALSYNEFEKCRKIFAKTKILNTDYSGGVVCLLAVPLEYDIISEITDITGRVPVSLLKEKSSFINY